MELRLGFWWGVFSSGRVVWESETVEPLGHWLWVENALLGWLLTSRKMDPWGGLSISSRIWCFDEAGIDLFSEFLHDRNACSAFKTWAALAENRAKQGLILFI